VGWGLVYFFFIPLYFIAFVRYDFHRKLLAIKGWMSDTIAKDSRTSAGGNFESLDPQLNVELTEKGNRMWKKRGEHIKGDPTSTVAVRSYSVVMSKIQISFLKPFDVWKPHFLSQGLPLTFTKKNVDRCLLSISCLLMIRSRMKYLSKSFSREQPAKYFDWSRHVSIIKLERGGGEKILSTIIANNAPLFCTSRRLFMSFLISAFPIVSTRLDRQRITEVFFLFSQDQHEMKEICYRKISDNLCRATSFDCGWTERWPDSWQLLSCSVCVAPYTLEIGLLRLWIITRSQLWCLFFIFLPEEAKTNKTASCFFPFDFYLGHYMLQSQVEICDVFHASYRMAEKQKRVEMDG
jgi:hypothetical protein